MKNLLDDAGYIEAVIRSIERLPLSVTEEMLRRLRGDDQLHSENNRMRAALEKIVASGGNDSIIRQAALSALSRQAYADYCDAEGNSEEEPT